MALDNIAVTVREGDSFDELYLNIEKPWGTPHDFSSSVLVADIRRFFNDSTTPSASVDSFGVVELDAAKGKIALKLTSRQTEALGRNVPLGYTERGETQSGLAIAADPTDELQGKFLWDLREYFSSPQATISSISSAHHLRLQAVLLQTRFVLLQLQPIDLPLKTRLFCLEPAKVSMMGLISTLINFQLLVPLSLKLIPQLQVLPHFRLVQPKEQ